MNKTHQKHAKIIRPEMGTFGRHEYAILGTPCGAIKKLATDISTRLSTTHKIAYVDADHKSADDASNLDGSSLKHGNTMEYIDKIDFHRYDQMGEQNPFDYKKKFVDQDLVLINGNHFPGQKQIVVIDSRKPLDKKLDKLKEVVLILFQDGDQELPAVLHSHLENIDQIPQLSIEDTSGIAAFIQNQLEARRPPIHGLVLAGGLSTRMKKDKSQIQYFGKSQKEHMYDLLNQITDSTYYAVRADQANTDSKADIVDTFTGLGPYGAILSAFRHNPNVAWLVTACDQPFLTKDTLDYLISKRNPSKVATAFYNPETDFPEPLITLWEPRAYSHLLHFLSLGYSCPRKVLINTDIEMISLDDPTALKNVNTPEEYKEAIRMLN
ncbi:MAG: NTP transferase domain-containing protein [Reichenbachiella sp.]|uniref:NTP transferase domain-containing protein n=1 Tax=Reichenbachiella sp. TaxID=2184521 RepID=UPI0032637936